MQCFKFNEEWKFEKSDSNSQLKAFQGEKGAIQVTLPYDAMIREKERQIVQQERRVVFIRGSLYL
ncbi:MAG: hypothetical protein ACLRMN_07860 [Mediterraneibacter gnavus]